MLASLAKRFSRHRLKISAVGAVVLLLLGAAIGLWRFATVLPMVVEANGANDGSRHAPAVQKAVVLTGSHDRLQAAMRLLHEEQVDGLFISGVYAKLKLSELLAVMQEVPSCAADDCIELGRRASNTRQNACESLEWLEKNNIRRFYLITSDYHWPRSYAEFQAVLHRNNYSASILPYAVSPKTTFWQGGDRLQRVKAWSAEYIKWLIANGRIFLENFLPKNTIMPCF